MLRKSRIVLLGGHLLLIAILWTGPAWGQRIRFPAANVAVAQAPASPPAWTAPALPPAASTAPGLVPAPTWTAPALPPAAVVTTPPPGAILTPNIQPFDPYSTVAPPLLPSPAAPPTVLPPAYFPYGAGAHRPRPPPSNHPLCSPMVCHKGRSGEPRPGLPISDCFNTRGSVTPGCTATRAVSCR